MISVIIPIYNEESCLPALYERLRKSLTLLDQDPEMIFVNDGSSDNSFSMIKQLSLVDNKVRYLNLSRNFGHQIAVTAGLDCCTGDTVVIIDADLQDPPELIKDLFLKLNEGYDVVYAKRRSRTGESRFKLLTARLFYRILGALTSISIPVDTGDFRIMTKRVVNVLKQMPEQHKFLRGQIAWIGFNQTFIEYDREVRNAGKTGYTIRKMLRLALDGITSFSNFPLKFASISGFVVSGITFLLMIYALYSRFVTKDYQPGWTSLMLVVLFIGGIQLISLGIIGEYISRLGENARQRPLYIVSETNIENGVN